MWKVLFLICLAVSASNACMPSGGETLVLMDNLAVRENHSIFFKSLIERGYKLTFKIADDPSLYLSRYGEYSYKNLIVFAPSVEEFGGDLNVEKLTKFVDDGGNILIAVNEQSGDVLREFAAECGLEIDEEGTTVIDHLNYDASDSGDHTKFLTSVQNLIDAPTIVGEARKHKDLPLVYKGTGLIAEHDNELVMKILTAESTAYCYNSAKEIKDYPHVIGRGTTLIAALQARNNARVVFSGSLYFFSDEAFSKPVQNMQSGATSKIAGNFEVATALSKWTFGESGRLRVVNVEHHKEGESQPPEKAYTITDNVVYSITIEEFKQNEWQPYKANDVQLEFVRIDPFVRTTLTPLSDGRYETKFKIPDVYGVYQFKVNYDRVGYSVVYNTTQVSVRPLEHTQYERFIPNAYPYYISAFSMMIGVFIFSFVFLHFKEDTIPSGKLKGDDKKTQ